MATTAPVDHPEGIFTPLDTDLYKLTMQCAVLKFFPDVHVTYAFTNRTAEKKLTRGAFNWLQEQISKLANLRVTEEELEWLRKTCPYFGKEYLDFLAKFRFEPARHIVADFKPDSDAAGDEVTGVVSLHTEGLWLDTILYEIPLLALTSEAYFKFVDRDWNYDGQVEKARAKGEQLITSGCAFSEFGTRRRRSYRTQDLVLQGLTQAAKAQKDAGYTGPGAFSGTSNVHFAMRYDVIPIGTVAHEWYMGIAALTDDYARANENAMRYWVRAFGRGVLAIALSDTFGTPNFLKAFTLPAPPVEEELVAEPKAEAAGEKQPSYAEIFTGVRQDSGDPLTFLERITAFYKSQGLIGGSQPAKNVVFSDSLNVDKCITYARATEKVGLRPSFGIGTFLTNDFVRVSATSEGQTDPPKSVPLNIVIKLSTAAGREAVKLSDDIGKNMGQGETIRRIKEAVGYEDRAWEGGDEGKRWG